MARFITKTPNKKYIRPVRYSQLSHKVTEVVVKKEEKKRKPKAEPKAEVTESVVNNVENVNDMADKNLEKVKALVGNDVEVPKRRVKREKKDKGLIERTEGSEILLTEDNKMLLND